MNVKLENVSTWFKSKKLSLNVYKTKWLLFHSLSKRQLLPQTLPKLLIENRHIKREHVAKFVVIFIDENLSSKQHINIYRAPAKGGGWGGGVYPPPLFC